MKRVVLIVTCVVVAALGWVFTVTQWETASRIATAASALAGVAAVGVAIWAGLGGFGQAEHVVRDTGPVTTGGAGNAVSGSRRRRARGAVTVERTGEARATGDGDAVSGYSEG